MVMEKGSFLTCSHWISWFPAHPWWRTATRQRGRSSFHCSNDESTARNPGLEFGSWLGWSMDFQLRCSWIRTQQSLDKDLPRHPLKPFGATGVHPLCPQPVSISVTPLQRRCQHLKLSLHIFLNFPLMRHPGRKQSECKAWKGKWCLW